MQDDGPLGGGARGGQGEGLADWLGHLPQHRAGAKPPITPADWTGHIPQQSDRAAGAQSEKVVELWEDASERRALMRQRSVRQSAKDAPEGGIGHKSAVRSWRRLFA